MGAQMKTPAGFNRRPLSNVKSNHEAGRKHSRRTESRRKKVRSEERRMADPRIVVSTDGGGARGIEMGG